MKTILKLLLMLVLLTICVSAHADMATETLKIRGSVAHELTLTRQALANYQHVSVHLNEILIDGRFRGVFELRGIPLKTLLESADIQKKETDFNKPVDLVVMITSSNGNSVALSWGEIFYRNAGEIIIATGGSSVLPHREIHEFSDQDAYRSMIKVLHREIGYPKLVVGCDFYADRAIENIVQIDVVDLRPDIPGKKSSTVGSDWFRVSGSVGTELQVNDLSVFSRQEITAHIVGEGRGYHGTRRFEGAPLMEILMKARPSLHLNTVFLVSAPDAYRSVLSYGEIFLKQSDLGITLADKQDGEDIKNGGRFIMILPEDLMADREVKAICRIEVIDMQARLESDRGN